jgi:hypothetical protein
MNSLRCSDGMPSTTPPVMGNDPPIALAPGRLYRTPLSCISRISWFKNKVSPYPHHHCAPSRLGRWRAPSSLGRSASPRRDCAPLACHALTAELSGGETRGC